ncbi:redoxin domain-containing protein [Halalkalicoccus sp. NIPERK01]|uniref:redoxin domain-containing protein n=1 Tax=Halalkalicoccus sp. NIPERK01 TaxID=3053469 RepID=UPI00256ED13E|nr:redoxin domain-containing protein [Halalkalicoccus sp. NIPERK01]MDL5362984.1 redoxin domain-containing protein [Halalkalicoccus sp. NIPERK01]
MVEFDVVDLGPAEHPGMGETAPDFTRPLVTREYWEDAALSDLADGGPVLLVFTPMDGAFPATYVWNEIRDRGWAESVTVVGLSISTPYEHKDLLEERGIDYGLFSDPGNGVAREYGIDHALDGMTGISEPRPAVFLLDTERVVEYAWVAEEWPEFPDYDAIEDAIESL